VIEQVAHNILQHAAGTGREVKVVYVNPIHDATFVQAGFRKLPESNAEVIFYASP
jgi:hypothetical protein